MSPDLSLIIFVPAVLSLAIFVRSLFGFGDALIAMPLLAMVVGLQTATPLVALVANTIALAILLQSWRSVQIKSAWRLILSSLVGIPLGMVFLKGVHEETMRFILGVLIAVFGLYNLFKPRLLALKDEKLAYIFGVLAGVVGGAYNTNGPIVVVYGTMRQWSPESFRATLQGYFFPTGLLILLGHGLSGLWTRPVLQLYALSLPATLAAAWLGGRLNRSVPAGKFDRYIHLFLLAIGAFLLIQSL